MMRFATSSLLGLGGLAAAAAAAAAAGSARGAIAFTSPPAAPSSLSAAPRAANPRARICPPRPEHFPTAGGARVGAIPRLMMSSRGGGDDDFDFDDFDDDDALSKLIGKRDVIRATKKEKPPSPTVTSKEETPSDAGAGAGAEAAGGGGGGGGVAAPPLPPRSDEDIVEPTVSLDDLNLDDLPEFKTKRPLRAPKKEEKERGGSDESDGAEDDTANYIDYAAEYDDENEFHIPNRMGFGTKAWGDIKRGFKDGKKLKKKDIKAGRYLAGDLQLAYDTLMESGVIFVDTSEAYGRALRKNSLSAEHILGRCVDENVRVDPIVASTFANPWTHLLDGGGLRFGRRGVVKALENTCDRLGVSGVELYQVPAALYVGFPNALADGLSECLDKGLCNYVGVCNMGKGRMRSMAKKMDRRGASLTSNQFEFSLMNRRAWKSGLIAACKDLGVIPIAHTPLDGGLATGVYTNTNPSGGKAGGKFPYELKVLNKWQPLTSMMETVQSKVKTRLGREKLDQQRMLKDYRGKPPDINTDVTTTQIAINYVIAKGCVPVPGVKSVAQAEEVLGCLGWGLSDDEVQLLDSAAEASEKGIKL